AGPPTTEATTAADSVRTSERRMGLLHRLSPRSGAPARAPGKRMPAVGGNGADHSEDVVTSRAVSSETRRPPPTAGLLRLRQTQRRVRDDSGTRVLQLVAAVEREDAAETPTVGQDE